MNTRNNFMPEPFAELADLIAQLRFTNEHADLRSGEYWTVYVHPWPGEQENCFDALISIIPRSPDISANQGFRLAAQRGITVWLSERETNRRGQTWVRRLPIGSYTARMGRVVSATEKDSGLAMAAEKCRKESAQSLKPAEEISSEPRIWYYLPDRRVTALLEQSESGQAEITFETEAPELAGAIVQFSVGEETGEVELKPSPPGAWSGYCYLNQPLHALRQEVPEFTLVLPPKPPKPEDANKNPDVIRDKYQDECRTEL